MVYFFFLLSSALPQRTFSFILNITTHAIQNESYLICLFKPILLDIKALSEVFQLCLKRTVYFYATEYRLRQLKG